MLTIEPPPAFFSAGTPPWMPLKTPVRLIATILSQSAWLYSSMGPGSDSRVVHEHVELAVLVDRRCDGCRPVGRLRHVEVYVGRRRSDLLRQRLSFLVQQVADDDLRALVGHRPCDGGADAAGATAHQRNLFLESSHVTSSSSFVLVPPSFARCRRLRSAMLTDHNAPIERSLAQARVCLVDREDPCRRQSLQDLHGHVSEAADVNHHFTFP